MHEQGFYFILHKNACWRSWSYTKVHSGVQGGNRGHTHIQTVTWSHTAETTLAITQTLAFVATVSVGFTRPRTRPPPLLSQKSLWTWPCNDTPHTNTHTHTKAITAIDPLFASTPFTVLCLSIQLCFRGWWKLNSAWVGRQTFSPERWERTADFITPFFSGVRVSYMKNNIFTISLISSLLHLCSITHQMSCTCFTLHININPPSMFRTFEDGGWWGGGGSFK